MTRRFETHGDIVREADEEDQGDEDRRPRREQGPLGTIAQREARGEGLNPFPVQRDLRIQRLILGPLRRSTRLSFACG